MIKHDEMDEILRKTLEDHKLSRTEKRALDEVIDEIAPNIEERAWLSNHAFDLAREEITGHENHRVLDWLEEVIKVIRHASAPDDHQGIVEAHFTPQHNAVSRIESLFRTARRSVDICVFTITDDRLSSAIIKAFKQGIKIRIITDDEKSHDRGSDIDQFFHTGIPIRTDHSEHHMHHKFAIFDKRLLLTGSYNWTRGAARSNQENFLIIDHPTLIKSYQETFERLWDKFEPE